MAEGAQDKTIPAHDMESEIKSAIISRSSYFQDQAESLTFEKVRRLLEKDLGLETHALDTHKRFIKHCLQSCAESGSHDDLSKTQGDVEGNVESTTEKTQSLDELQVNNEVREPNSGSAETMEDSLVMGLMTGSKKERPNDGIEDTESKQVPNEITIEKAVRARASYIKENSESITLAGLRRLLEEDLGIEKHALDPFKKFISKQVDEVLNSPESPQPTVSKEKKNPKKDSHRKVSSKSSKEEKPTPASSGSESDEVEEEEVTTKKKNTPKKRQKPEAVKKRPRTNEKSNGAKTKQRKVSKSSKDVVREEEGGDGSENDNSDSSTEKSVKKKDIPKPSYGKEVERLKSVIRACGMSISPAVYKKVKQAPENKRESCLIKELEGILSKEGLSSNPSEKEIKDVKKSKERAKELEGIDLSNIVSSSRRRSTTSFIPPPKPKIPDLSESESEESEDEEDEEDEEEGEEGEEEVENEDVDQDQEDGGKGSQSQSEESEKGNNDSD